MNTFQRRDFIKKSAMGCLGGCLLMHGSGFTIAGTFFGGDELPDPSKLNYCGYTCPDDCQFRKATLADDPELKKEAFEIWQIKERYGVDYDPETAFCHGCKTEEPFGVVTSHCTVRTCAMEKELDACIECDELTGCDKDLWKRFPEFYEQVKVMQQKFRAG